MTLNSSSRSQYDEDGYYHPIDVLSSQEAARYREKLEAAETAQGHNITGPERSKSHLIYTWGG